MNVLELAKEQQRQQHAVGDDKYLRQFVYYFELRIPPQVAKGSTQSYIYPLIIPPESYRMSEPFAVEKTPTNYGGLWVEESGILWRELTLSGTTGWKPRRLPKLVPASTSATVAVPYEGKSHSRSQTFVVAEALSGQRHFQFLQDAVFRTYGDLKRDPATAEGTELFFHNPKDDEHWRVVPTMFDMERSARSSNLYRYTIQLLCVEGAASASKLFSEDEATLKQIKDGIRMARFGASLITGAINDLTNVQSELRATFLSVGTILEGAGQVADATQAFLQGTQSLIAVPLAYVESVKFSLDESLAAFDELLVLGQADDVPDSVLNTMRRLGDGLNVIASYPELFRTSVDNAVASFQNKADLSTSRTATQLALAAEQPAPQTFRDFSQHGTALLPGDYLRARDELGLGRNLPRFTGADERVIERGDTLPNLAGRYMGDARKWKFIAVFNDLQPPYISDDGLPGTLKVGDTILIPNFSRASNARSSPVVLGVKGEQPGEEHALGVDLMVKDSGNGLYDLVIDVEGGSIDMKLVRGRDCLSQGILSRLTTERGHDLLYKTLGVQRVVGLGLTVVDRELAQMRLVEAVQSDPRIAAVRNLVFQNEPNDALVAEIDAEVRGISRSEKVLVRP